MSDQFLRTELLLGREGVERLHASRVAVFGIGGVGSYVVEALSRSGIGTLDLIDNDRVSLSNLNRQIIATHSALGRYKVEVARERVLDINPEAQVNIFRCFYLPETAEQFDFTQYDYVVDAIDTVTGKLQLVMQAEAAGTRIISSMGTGNKLRASALEIADIYDTSVCPLARVMRRELKKRGVRRLKVVYSREEPLRPRAEAYSEDGDCADDGGGTARRAVPGSTAFVPAAAGLLIAGEVVRELSGIGAAGERKNEFLL